MQMENFFLILSHGNDFLGTFLNIEKANKTGSFLCLKKYVDDKIIWISTEVFETIHFLGTNFEQINRENDWMNEWNGNK